MQDSQTRRQQQEPQDSLMASIGDDDDPVFVVPSDSRPLVDDDDERQSRSALCWSWLSRHRWPVCLSVIFALILSGHAVVVYYIYFRCSEWSNCVSLKVMALNTWGMPAVFGSQYKTERMKAIAEEFSKGEHDLYLFEELWMSPDHDTVSYAAPEGFTITAFRELSLSTCDGRVLPTACSGLTIASRYPIEETEFNSFTDCGNVLKIPVDGECLAKKGVGRVRIKVLHDVTVDVFVTHTIADPDPKHNYTNEYYRVLQVKELMEKYIKKSDADVILLGGDFNEGPVFKKGSPYDMIRSWMSNCVEDFLHKLEVWLSPPYATYGNPANTFSSNFAPVIYDFIFHKGRNESRVNVYTDFFHLPIIKTLVLLTKERRKEAISLSDHEAVTSVINVWKKR